MNKDQGKGIVERLLYGAILFVAMKFVAWGYIDAEMAAYIAAGGVAAAGAGWAWWNNRPSSLLTRAGDALPKNVDLVLTPNPGATSTDRKEAHALADAASDKVTAKT